MYIIRSVSGAEKRQNKRQFPLSEPKDWELLETIGTITKMRIGYYDTRAEAEAEEANLKFHDALHDDLEEWVEEMAQKYGKQPSQIEKVIKEGL